MSAEANPETGYAMVDNGQGPDEGSRPQPAKKRYLVKMTHSPNPSDSRRSVLACALNLEPGGMLVESQHPLTVGEAVYWSFMGVPELRGVTIPGTVLQEEPRPEWASQNRYYFVRFDDGAGAALSRLGISAEEAALGDSC